MKSPIKRKFKVRYLILLLIIGTVIAGYVMLKPKDVAPVFQVKRGEFLIDIRTKGKVQAIDSYVIKSPSNIWGNARIVKMAPEGAEVNPGDFLIQFDTAEFMQKLQNEQNTLETAQADYESRLANIRKTSADLESQLQIESYNLEQTRLRAKNAIYEAENKRKEIELTLKKAEISYQQLIDKIAATKKIDKASIRQAELQVEQAKINVKRATDDLSKLTITSPAKGLVVYKESWEGSGGETKIKIGSTPWRSQPLMEIPDQSRMKVLLTVNEVDISRLKLGQEVIIKLDAIVDTVFAGKITVISALAYKDYYTNKNVFDVEASIDGTDDRLKSGMSANCQIIVDRIPGQLFIPIDAVETRSKQVGVCNQDGEFVFIKTGLTNSDFIIVEKGLKDGDAIRLREEKGTQKELPKNDKNRQSSERRGERRVIVR